jgi:isopentenyldiphosphate isomerase
MINASELLFVVDENDNPLVPLPRKDVRANGHWCRCVHVWIINDKQELLCQKRSELKDLDPGNWETFVGGHVGAGDEYTVSAIREVYEETGIMMEQEKLKLVKLYKDPTNRQFRGIYYYKWNGSLDEVVKEEDEVAEVAWLHVDQVHKHLVTDKHPGWYRPGYEEEILPLLKTV